jgi:UDP-N-acetylmuramoyl-tripeptide--D-alanyl-D-alanine ligase
MTGRAKRVLVVSVAICAILLLVTTLIGLSWGAGGPLLGWVVGAVMLFLGVPLAVVAADFVLGPLQISINRRFTRAATSKLAEVSPVVVGVTGSFGKTSTKFAIERLLDDGRGMALATPGSFNTPLGISRTINEQLGAQHRYFVVEMGAYGEGEIAELCNFVHPTIGVLTAIGPAHLDRFGSMDAIRRAKYEIVTSLPPEGTAVMNVDDGEVRALADATHHVGTVRYGVDPDGAPHITASQIAMTADGASFVITDTRDGASLPVSTRLLGSHSIGHVLAAVAVALTAGRHLQDLRSSIESLEPVEHRLQLLKGAGGITVIDDAYNSNPDGAAAALEVLSAMPARRRVVVTPGMIELGDRQFEENQRFGAHAATVADVLVVVARTNRAAISSGALSSGGAQVVTVDSLAQATERLPAILAEGDVVLFENDLPDHYEG